jgi:hypothetical protein
MSRSVAVNSSCGAGLLLIVYAAWLTWPPLAFATAGGLLCAFGVFVYRSSK